MTRYHITFTSLVSTIALAASAAAQEQPTPPPFPEQPAPGQPAPPAQPAPGQPAPPAPDQGQTPPDQSGSPVAPPGPAPAPQATPSPYGPPSAEASVEGDVGFTTELDGGMEAESPLETRTEDWQDQWRTRSMHAHNGLNGSTGLLRVVEAGSGSPGTFRVSFLGSWYSGSGFLCSADTPCPSVFGEDQTLEDDVTRVGAHLGLSASLFPFLEAFIGLHNQATSNTRGRPQLLQILGDTNLGVKAFMPWEPGSIFSFGGQVDLWLLNGTGGVGLDGDSTSFSMAALGTMDLGNQLSPEDRIPLRFHTNVGYLFDNSASIVEELEATPPPAGRGDRITRIERFGLDINRVDSFQIGLGAEFIHEFVRPYVEWTIDIPVNRQEYSCNQPLANQRGDLCLGDAARFSTVPSRLTLGASVYPWEGRGLAVTAAADIGTGATSSFIEEVSPELPWNLYLGLSYAVDTNPPEPVVERVEVERQLPPPPPAPEYYISGKVVEMGNQDPVANAIVRYEGQDRTGMVTDEQGQFRTAELEPGTFTFNVSAEGYRDGQCSAVVEATPAGMTGSTAAPAQMPPGPYMPGPDTPPGPYVQPGPNSQPGPYTPPGPYTAPAYGQQPEGLSPGQPTEHVTEVTCELKALPKVGNIIGVLVDAETNEPVAGAKVTIKDNRDRQLDLPADEQGSFRFNNVPSGTATVKVEAEGYLTTVTEFDVKGRQDIQARISLNKRPKRPNVVVTNREVKLKKKVHFQHDSAEIQPDSMAILEELAEVLREREEITKVEVQGHTDDTGTPAYNQRLSQNRAKAVVDALVRLGVDPDRLDAKGYGQEKPILPNSSDANRARNRRVQVIIKERDK